MTDEFEENIVHKYFKGETHEAGILAVEHLIGHHDDTFVDDCPECSDSWAEVKKTIDAHLLEGLEELEIDIKTGSLDALKAVAQMALESGQELDTPEPEFLENVSKDSPWNYEFPTELEKALKDEKLNHIDTYSQQMWFQLWPNVKPTEIDVAQAAADFYLLFGMSNNSFVDFQPMNLPTVEQVEKAGKILKFDASDIERRIKEVADKRENDPRYKLTTFSKKAEVKFVEFINYLDKSFREYVHMACGGELRHHSLFSGSFRAYRKGAWCKWKFIYDQYGPDALVEMSSLFREFTPGSHYGGERWATASDILYQRELGLLGPDEITNKQLFVDRVFTLEHNGGCFLNKIDWPNFRKDREAPYNTHFRNMKDHVLEAHAASPTDIDKLFGFASESIQNMVVEYLKVAEDNDIEISGTWKGITPEGYEEAKAEVKKQKNTPSYKDDVKGVIDWDSYIKKEEEKKKAAKKPKVVSTIPKSYFNVEKYTNFKIDPNESVTWIQDSTLKDWVEKTIKDSF